MQFRNSQVYPQSKAYTVSPLPTFVIHWSSSVNYLEGLLLRKTHNQIYEAGSLKFHINIILRSSNLKTRNGHESRIH